MSKVVYPGILTEKEKVNINRVTYKDAEQRIFFLFDSNNINSPRRLFTLPPGGVLHTQISGNVIQPFPEVGYLFIGTKDDYTNIARVPVNVPGPFHMVWSGIGPADSYHFMTINKISLEIYMVVKTVATTSLGNGFGLISWLDLNKVQGYRRI